MKWGMKIGETKIWTGFAWLPIRLTSGEWVWLETVLYKKTCFMGVWKPYSVIFKETLGSREKFK